MITLKQNETFVHAAGSSHSVFCLCDWAIWPSRFGCTNTFRLQHKGPSIYYVSMFLAIFGPTHLSQHWIVLKISKNLLFFLTLPNQIFADVKYGCSQSWFNESILLTKKELLERRKLLKKHIGKPARLVKLSFIEKKGNNTLAKVIFSIIFVKSF